MVQNRAIIYKSIPDGFPVPGKDLVLETREFDLNQAAPAGGITTKNFYASFDPYMRGKMRDPSQKSYTPAYVKDAPMQTFVVARVLKSDHPSYKVGDLVKGYLNIEEYSTVGKEHCEKGVFTIENPYNLDPHLFIGALGMPGLTAYSSLYSIGKPKKGETIFISAASGAVGQVVGQLAKHEGLTVIGSVGSDEKLDFILNELNFDAGFNYKKEKPAHALQRLSPNGIDIYYENVGGETLEAAIDSLRDFGRIVACGMISQYNIPEDQRTGPKNISKMVSKRLTMSGFIISDPNMGLVYTKEHQKRVQQWLSEGSFKAQASITDGIEKGPEGFLGMLKGENFGKAVLKIADPSI